MKGHSTFHANMATASLRRLRVALDEVEGALAELHDMAPVMTPVEVAQGLAPDGLRRAVADAEAFHAWLVPYISTLRARIRGG